MRSHVPLKPNTCTEGASVNTADWCEGECALPGEISLCAFGYGCREAVGCAVRSQPRTDAVSISGEGLNFKMWSDPLTVYTIDAEARKRLTRKDIRRNWRSVL